MRLPAVLPPLLVALAIPAVAHGADLYVNPAQLGLLGRRHEGRREQRDDALVLAAPALRLTAPGDVVHLAAATYAAQFRPVTSGTPRPPIIYQADGAVTIAAPAGAVSVMLVGVHDIVLRGVTVLAAAPQAVCDRQRGPHRPRRGHRDQQRRHGRPDQGAARRDDHALEPRRQLARGPDGHGPGGRHDAQRIDGQRQRQGRAAVQRRRRRSQRQRRLGARQHDHRQRRRRRLRARHLRRPDGERLHDRAQPDRRQRGRRHQGRRRPGTGRRQPPRRRRCSGS